MQAPNFKSTAIIIEIIFVIAIVVDAEVVTVAFLDSIATFYYQFYLKID